MNHAHRKPCPVWEALFWTFGYQIAQGVVLAMFIAALTVLCFGFEWPTSERLLDFYLELNLDRSFLLIGVTTLGALFLIVPALKWRMGVDFRSTMDPMPTRQEIIFATATIVPIAVLGDITYEFAQKWFVETQWPVLAAVSRTTTLEHLHQSTQQVPYWILVVAMALGPAIGEELVFRGFIGQGLVRRYGVVPGVILTSLLFAMAHFSPAHAIATIPVAVLLHTLYLQTKSIWIPILVHFGNNLLAVTMVRFQIVPDIPISPTLLIVIGLYLLLLMTGIAIYCQPRHTTNLPATS